MTTPPRDWIPSKKRSGKREDPSPPIMMPVGPMEPAQHGWSGLDHHGDVNIGFTVLGKPEPMPRPRFSITHGIYSPKKTEDQPLYKFAKRLVDDWHRNNRIAKEAPPFFPLMKESWLSVSLTYRIQRPKSHFRGKARSKDHYTKRAMVDRPTGGDLDNLVKMSLDCLVKAKMIEDDSAVCHINAWKAWADPVPGDGEEESVTVLITQLNQPYKSQIPDKSTVEQRWIF